MCKIKQCSPACTKCAHPLHGSDCPYSEIRIMNKLKKEIVQFKQQLAEKDRVIELMAKALRCAHMGGCWNCAAINICKKPVNRTGCKEVIIKFYTSRAKEL
jgi:hypothetical protein